MPTNQLIPSGQGPDFYTTEFSDAAIRRRWVACKQNATCYAQALAGAKPFIAYEKRVTGEVDPFGKVDPEGDVDLKSIRRPGYFARNPYAEPIAEAEPRTTTVEFTVPRDSYERRHLGKEGTIKLRGWYIEGTGIEAANGTRRRALVIMNNGGGSELTAIDDPRALGVQRDASGRYLLQPGSDGLSEQHGMRHWRGFIAALNAAGFDVLVTDRRGNGIAGGVAGFNTAEQANDMFRELDQMETGEGLRLLTPAGEELAQRAAAGRLMSGMKATEIPVVLMGYSRGSYATAWAMQKNFVQDCDRDIPDGLCHPALGRPNIKGAILYGPNAAGLGYRVAGHDMIEAALRTEYNTTYYVDSDVFANVGKWPALMIVKGTWDYVEGLEGSLEAWRMAREPKEIFVFRGPHPLATQNAENMRLVGIRMASFARAAVLGERRADGASAPSSLKELVLSSPNYWELTTDPH
jgi:pimeloyl-ACP methyl ester carboxylesterase